MAFQRAVKHDARLRMSISGPSGSGKTWTALTLATRLAGNEPFAVLDTERGSASKYADDFSFDVMELDTFDPRNYVKAIHEAEEAGYTVMVIDSLTHAWNGTGGLLDIVDAIAKRKYNNNTFAAWKDATPIQNALIDAITSAKLHIIVTMRSKQEFVQEKNEKTGRTEIKKMGMAPIQRDGFEYELDIAVDMDIDNTMIVQKSRCSKLAGQIIPKPDSKVADTLKEWLRGAPVPVVAASKPTEIKEEKPAQQATSAASRTQPAPAKPVEQKPANGNAPKLASIPTFTGLRNASIKYLDAETFEAVLKDFIRDRGIKPEHEFTPDDVVELQKILMPMIREAKATPVAS